MYYLNMMNMNALYIAKSLPILQKIHLLKHLVEVEFKNDYKIEWEDYSEYLR